MRPQKPGRARDLQQIAAAVVGTAAGAQWVADGKSRPELEAEVARLRARVAELEQAAPAAALDVHAALNTYEVAADVPPGFDLPTPNMLLVIGANHRRLIVRKDAAGVWIGGCLISERFHLVRLVSWLGGP